MEAKSSDGGGVRLHVGGLGESVGRDDLIKIFSPMGKVEDVEFVRTKGRSFAYIDFSPSSTNSLTKLFSTYNGCVWKGGRLRLEKAKEHYMARLKREWEAASSTSDNTIKAPSDSTPSTHINIFFPRLRKVKAMPLSGTGKHKYSFQRVPVPSLLPKSFCDCEEHSNILTPRETHIHDMEALDGGINVDEVNVMKSVMNKLFQEHNIPTSEQVPEEDNEIEADQDNLIINVVSSGNDMGKSELDLLTRKRKSMLNETTPSGEGYSEGRKGSKKTQAIIVDENGRQESTQAIRQKKKLCEVKPDKPSDEPNRTTGVKRSIGNIAWSQTSSWKSLMANGNSSDFSVSSFLPGVGSSKAVQPAPHSTGLAGFHSQENLKEKKKSKRITSTTIAVDLPASDNSDDSDTMADDIESDDSDSDTMADDIDKDDIDTDTMANDIERDDSDAVEDDIERDAVEDDTASDSMADGIERDDSDTMADDIERDDSDTVEDDIERDDTNAVEDDTASDSMAVNIERDDSDTMADDMERDDSDTVEDNIEKDDTDAVDDDTGNDSVADDTDKDSVAGDTDNDSVADDTAIDAVSSDDSESLADTVSETSVEAVPLNTKAETGNGKSNVEKHKNVAEDLNPEEESIVVKENVVDEEKMGKEPVKAYNKSTGSSWIQKASWTQLVGDKNTSSFSITQLFPDLNSDQGEAARVNNNVEHQNTNSDQSAGAMKQTEYTCSSGGFTAPGVPVDNNTTVRSLDENRQHLKGKNLSKEVRFGARKTIKRKVGSGETCGFMRSSASLKEWAKAKKALSEPRRKKNSEE